MVKLQTINKFNEAKNWCFEKINEIEKPLARLMKRDRRHKLPISAMKQVISLQTLQTSKG